MATYDDEGDDDDDYDGDENIFNFVLDMSMNNHSQAFFQCPMCASEKIMLEKLHSVPVLLRT